MAATLAQAALWSQALTSQFGLGECKANRSGFRDAVLAMAALCLLWLSFYSCFDNVFFCCSLMVGA